MPKQRPQTEWWARFLYQNFLYGEWTKIEQERPMFPNPQYKHTLVSVEFKEIPCQTPKSPE